MNAYVETEEWEELYKTADVSELHGCLKLMNDVIEDIKIRLDLARAERDYIDALLAEKGF